MSTDLLFENFSTLATAPDGIVRLRELILQLAVQGKLGTQDEGDEPASVLLEKIKREKERLVKDGKIPKEKPTDNDNENIFNQTLPKHWILVRLGEISDKIHYGYTASADKTEKRIRLLRITDIQNNRVNWDLVPGCEIDDSNFLSYSIKAGDLLIARTGGTIGKSYLVRDQPVPAVFASYLIRVVPNENLNPEYMKLFADSPTYWNQLHQKCMGTGQPNVNGTSLRSLIIPLPPLAEQHRIVAKVDRLMALCDELETWQKQERVGCLRLGTASLVGLQNAESIEEFERQWAQVCDAFDLILDCPENAAVLRQTILHLAIYGKFKTQIVDDKPVKIDSDENDDSKNRSLDIFRLIDLPNKWIWTKLGNISKVGQGGTPSTNFPEYWNGSVPWLRSGDIKFNRIKKANETISELGLKNSAATMCPIGTVMLAMTGQGVTRGRAAILDIESSANQSCAHIILDKDVMIPEFLFYFFRTEYWNIRTLDKGTGQPGLNTKIIKMFDIPLPPLAEQHRIVAKVDALMVLCDALESRLKERAVTQRRLANAIVKNMADA